MVVTILKSDKYVRNSKSMRYLSLYLMYYVSLGQTVLFSESICCNLWQHFSIQCRAESSESRLDALLV